MILQAFYLFYYKGTLISDGYKTNSLRFVSKGVLNYDTIIVLIVQLKNKHIYSQNWDFTNRYALRVYEVGGWLSI